MPAVFTGRWTRGTILDQALQRVGNTKIKQLGRDRLNRVLEELYSQWEWPFLYTVSTFTFPSGNTGGGLTIYPSTTLPSDFLKTEHETVGIRITTIDGNVQSFPVVEVDPILFKRRAIPYDQQGQRPIVCYVSYAERILYFWPAPTSACTATMVYKFLPPDKPISTQTSESGIATDPVTIAYDADIPLFPWGGYLSMVMEAWAFQYDQSPLARDAAAQAAQAFDEIRNIALPRQSQETTLPLDPTIFGPPFRDERGRFYRGTDGEWW